MCDYSLRGIPNRLALEQVHVSSDRPKFSCGNEYDIWMGSHMRNIEPTNARSTRRCVIFDMPRVLIGLFLLKCICLAQPLPPNLRQALAHHLKASEDQLKRVEGGEIVVYAPDTNSREEIALVGVARIWTTPEAFLKQYRDISAFEAGPGVRASGKFSHFPTMSDMKDLNLTAYEANEIRHCRAGDCGFKLGDPEIQFFRSSVDWKAPDYSNQTTLTFRRFWLNYVNRYRSSGNSALLIYHDSPKYSSIATGLTELLASEPMLHEFSPGLVDWARSYPQSTVELSDEFIYWQAGKFGLKPVHRISHVAIQNTDNQFGNGFIIASKMLYASHYFRSALELQYVIPGKDQHIGGMHYLVIVQRSRVDGMGGFRGRLIRPIAKRKASQTLERHLVSAKRRVEAAFNAAGGN